MKARDIMTKNPTCCKEDDAVLQAVKVMKDKDTGVIPIENKQGECVGIITDRDVCLEVVLPEKSPRDTKLSSVMTQNIECATPDEDLDQVLQRMERRQIRRIPVVDEARHCVGIISQKDIATRDKQKGAHTAELVEAVSRG